MSTTNQYKDATDGTAVIADDPYLEPYKEVLINRYNTFLWWKNEIIKHEGSFDAFTQAYKKFGFQKKEDGISYQVWAPGAHELYVVGDFNDWKGTKALRNEFGVWTAFIPNNEDGSSPIAHLSKVKLIIKRNGNTYYRIDPWSKYVLPSDDKTNFTYEGIYWDPPHPYVWKHVSPLTPNRLRIYECHIGLASDKEEISSYNYFKENILSYIKETGYNTIQIMAVMEHTYYASFGYQVTNFFAASSRYGTPDELKALIDKAHELGLTVLLDVVHSHASKNSDDGLNYFDGTDTCFFHSESGKGVHPIWDSRLFDYSQWEVLRFLLSNLRWWLEEYHFDGFRFDGVTAMLLESRAVGVLPTNYDGYFGYGIDGDALRYLTLANYAIKELFPNAITIAEDASGFACLARPVKEGGVGFDYRLGMGIPDKWKQLMKTRDEDWNVGNITFELSNRRWKEATVAYVECHDQALVGDKTLAFWLMDADMYTDMSVLNAPPVTIDRGIQLHKMIRLITCGLGGEGYLTFMGNEFGHPEWLDFPREGNNWSYKFCKRQWNLQKDHLLRYKFLYNFDKAMMKLEEKYAWLRKSQYVSLAHESDKVVVFERGELVFAFNFHPTQSFADYTIPVEQAGKYKIVLNSDAEEHGGHNRIDTDCFYFTKPAQSISRSNSMKVYLPCRVALVFAPVEF